MNKIWNRILNDKTKYINIFNQRGVKYAKQKVEHLLEIRNMVVSSNNEMELLSIKIKALITNHKDNLKELKTMSLRKHDIQANIIKLNKTATILLQAFPNVSRETIPIKSQKLVEEVSNFPLENNKLSYIEIAQKFNLVDISDTIVNYGRRYVSYIEKGAELIRALYTYCIDFNKNAMYKEIMTPSIVSPTLLTCTGQLPKFKNDLFLLDNDNFLSPTGEVQLVNYFNNKIIDINVLPISLTTYSQCFRKEVGSAGQQNKSMLRLHQFNKVEIVKFCLPENSNNEFENMFAHIKKILISFELNFRVIELSIQDLAFSSAKTYDFEIFFSFQKEYVEISSLSNCLDFQSIRGNIRTIDKELKQKSHPHTLNGSSLAIDRLFCAIIENCYNDKIDKIIIPKILHKYLDYKTI